MVSFLDRILHSSSSADIIHLLNDYLSALRRSGGMRQIPPACRPHSLKTVDDLAVWLDVIGSKLARQTDHSIGVAEPMLALDAVLKGAEGRLRELQLEDSRKDKGGHDDLPSGKR